MQISSDQHLQLAANLQAVRERIARAAARAGRSADQIRLVGVTKYVEADVAAALVSLGLEDLGESRPQTLWEKAERIPPSGVRWHLVGPLQRNKIRRTLPLVHLIHSVDSLRLMEAIDRIAAEQERVLEILLEVNVSGEASKQGLAANAVAPLLDQGQLLSAVRIRGFMCMSGLESTPDERQREFAQLREIREKLRPNYGGNISLQELSMGMSDDFELAIAEGATIVRIGSILFDRAALRSAS